MAKIWTKSDSDDEYTDALIVNIDDIRDRGIAFMTGKPLDAVFPDTTVEIQTDHPPDDFFEAGIGMPVVSDGVRSVLEEFKANAEFFPLHIRFEGKDYIDRAFYFMNVTALADVIDHQNGEFTFWEKAGFTDHVDKIMKLAIDEHKASPYPLFRIAKGGEYLIGVNDALADRLSAAPFTGMRFVNPNDWKLC
jgi:hypothetical protein